MALVRGTFMRGRPCLTVCPMVASSNQQQDYGSQEQRPWDQHNATKVEFSQEEKQKNWYDLDPERRQQLEVSIILSDFLNVVF